MKVVYVELNHQKRCQKINVKNDWDIENEEHVAEVIVELAASLREPEELKHLRLYADNKEARRVISIRRSYEVKVLNPDSLGEMLA